MNVQELVDWLSDFPEDAPVIVSCPYDSGWCRTSGEATSVRIRDNDDAWFDPNAKLVILIEAAKSEDMDNV